MVVGETVFFGSQLGGEAVINYSYTDLPWRLFAFDMYYFFQFIWALPWIVLPLRPWCSGELDELYPSAKNLWCILVHVLLVILQIGFIVCLPFAVAFPLWVFALGVGAFYILNYSICTLLNGTEPTYTSDEQYAPALPQHAHEQWIFVNGVAVGEHWMKNNLNRLALTFKRPVMGIHNQTSGIIFDVMECLIQRNLGYATYDIRVCYRILKEKLYDPKLSKVVLILHSQGGIEGGMVIDWLLQELPQDLLSKLEVYTFGCAANHFNNPHRHILSQRLAQLDPDSAVETTTTTVTQSTPVSSPVDMRSNQPQPPTLPLEPSSSMTSIQTHCAAQDRAIAHIEHYAHTTDFVALWGVLHFVTSSLASHTLPRFIGRLFARNSDHGGHQFNQHYLNGMFPLEKDSKTGEFIGCAEENEFMDSGVKLGRDGDASQNAREAFEISWMGSHGFGSGSAAADVDVHIERGRRRIREGTIKVKDLSRLWLYRNGRSPNELPPLLVSGRNVTL